MKSGCSYRTGIFEHTKRYAVTIRVTIKMDRNTSEMLGK